MSDRPDRPDAVPDTPPESPLDTQPIAPQAPPDVPETPLARVPSEERQVAALPVPPAPLEPPDFETAEHVAVAPEAAAPPPAAEQATRPTPVPPAGEKPSVVKRESPALPLPEGEGHCPRCGSTDLGQGSLVAYGTRFRPAYFKPSRLSFFRLHNALRPFRQLVEVQAQVCRHCGLIMAQVDPARLAKVERRSDDRR